MFALAPGQINSGTEAAGTNNGPQTRPGRPKELEMHKTLQVAARVATLGFVMLFTLAASPAFAQKGKPVPYVPVPLNATFVSSNLPNVMCDTKWDPSTGVCYSGTFLTPPSTTLEGAFINSLGGIDINLVSGARQMVFQFDTEVGVQGSTPCYLPANVSIPANVVDFRFNATQYSNGVLGMTIGQTLTAFGGSINFTPIAGFTSLGTQTLTNVFLRFGTGYYTGTKTLTRVSATDWQLLFQGSVQVQCTTTRGRGKATLTEMGTFSMPFEMDVVVK